MTFHIVKIRFLYFSGLLLTAFLSVPTLGAEKAVILNGNYVYDAYAGKQVPIFTRALHFTVALAGCSWVIEYTKINPTKNDLDDLTTVASCDGTNVYVVHYPSDVAQVFSGCYPYSRGVDLQYIWIAFASRCVLKGPKGMAKPPFPEDIGIFTRNDYTCRYQWITHRDGIPNKLQFLDDGTFWARNHVTGQIVHERCPSPYSGGYTLATGQWVSVTNVAGTLIPTIFQLTGFAPKSSGSSATDLEKMFTFHSFVTNITVSGAPQIPAKPPDKAVVFDRRFMGQGYAYVSYVVTNGAWPSKEKVWPYLVHAPKFSAEDEALAQLGIRQIGDTLSPNQLVSRRKIVKWVVLFAAVIPAIYICAQILRRKKRTTITRNK